MKKTIRKIIFTAVMLSAPLVVSAHSTAGEIAPHMVRRASLIWDVLKGAKELGDKGRRIGCFQPRTGWHILEPPTLSEWGCLLKRR